MKLPYTAPLFAWAYLEDNPSLHTLRQLLEAIPDDGLLAALRSHRGRGRNEYPVETLWGTLLLTVALRHTSIDACLSELQRNSGLRLLIGIRTAAGVPKPWNLSRFMKLLGEEPFRGLKEAAFDAMVRRLGEAVPSLGAATAGDSTGLSARKGRPGTEGGLPPPTGGRKEYTDAGGKVVRVVEWFGYKLHLVVDARHEVALAYRVTDTKAGDGETLPGLLDAALGRLPEGRMKTLAYDLAADSQPFHAALHARGVRPVVQMRDLWTGSPDRPLPGHGHLPVRITYDQLGTVHCWDDSGPAPVRRRMAYTGHEPARGTLKYRCPAMTGEWRCGCERKCNHGKTYGLTVRVRRELDLRRFPPIPRATKAFERLYRGRTSVERVNGRLKMFWGADDGNLSGAARFHAYVDAVMLVHLAFATVLAGGGRPAGSLGAMGLGKVQEALRRR
ncbi:MAG: Transposase DDE domain protein [Lentisphaerae bacterium ADurb.BinA184]|nr:MAG: Transposase DDE domain protein [Lentisphaerae bacterium ADurb.BinA184]